MKAEIFLQKYRILEGLLEKRYDGRRMSSSSVVMEYIRDQDSDPVRVDLDLIREIRNILSHNADPAGGAVVQPSQAMIDCLDAIIDHVKRPRLARHCGTPAERILSAHPNDNILNLMRNMRKNGYSHVPVTDGGRFAGVFSIKCLFDYLAQNGFDALDRGARIADLGDAIGMDKHRGERYLFVPADTSIVAVRNAFETHRERNNRLGLVFVTEHGTADEPIICMLSPWDVLNNESL